MALLFRIEGEDDRTRPRAGAGFTLIELLIAVGIFIIFSSLIIVNYQINEKAKALKNQAQIIVSGLERAQTMALTGELVGGQSPLAYKFSISNPCTIPAGCSYALSALFSDEPEVEIAKTMLNNVKIEGGSFLPVLFYPPRGKMVLSDSAESGVLKVYNREIGQIGFCVRIGLNAVSGRISLFSGGCD